MSSPVSGESRSSGEYRAALHDYWSDDDLSFEERVEQMLTVAGEYLGIEHGHVARHDPADGTEYVVASTGDTLAPAGTTLDHSTTYCRRTVDADATVALSNAPEQGWAGDPAYETHGMSCYIGSNLTVDGETYGTVCFTAQGARVDSFTADEKLFVELLARLLERTLESDRYEREIRSSERKYKTLIETAPDAILLLDAETLAIEEVNEAATALTGYDEGDLLGSHVARVFPVRAEKFEEQLGQFRDGETKAISRLDDGTQLLVETATGDRVPVEISERVVDVGSERYVQSIIRDISERRERQQELQTQKRAMDAADVGITIADARTPNNELVYVNEKFCEITGYDEAEMLGRNCRTLQGSGTEPGPVAALQEAIAAEETVSQELRNYRADGTPFWNLVTVTPVRNDRGEVTHFVGFQQDITDRKRRERLLEVLDRVLRHNLRNDMNKILGFAELVSDAVPEDSREAELLAEMTATARDLHGTSETARTLKEATDGDGSVRTVDVMETVERLGADLRGRTPDATVRVETDGPADALVTDHVDTALRELAENAVEHAGPAPTVTLGVTRDGDSVRVTVADDGPGMSSADRQVVETGQETDLEHGSGLGLWLVHWLVTASDGRVEVSESEGGGTCVTVTLPRA